MLYSDACSRNAELGVLLFCMAPKQKGEQSLELSLEACPSKPAQPHDFLSKAYMRHLETRGVCFDDSIRSHEADAPLTARLDPASAWPSEQANRKLQNGEFQSQCSYDVFKQ